MRKTIVDFWRLIWQERPGLIVMMTNLKDRNVRNCEQYWPNGVMDEKEFGPFTVTLSNERVYPNFVERTLIVTVSQNNQVLEC